MSEINYKETNKSLFKNTGIIAIGQISTKLINFLLLPLYTSLLTTDEYGLVDLLTTYTAFFSVIIGLQMSQALFRFLVTARNDNSRKQDIISTIVIATVGVIFLYSVMFLSISGLINIQCKWFLLAHVVATIFLQTASGIARGLGNNTEYAAGSFISAIVTLVLNVLFIAVLRLNIVYMLAAYAIGPLMGGIYIVLRLGVYRYIRLNHANKKDLKMILRYALPLVPNELSWSVIHASDRVIVSAMLSVAANGLIAVASKFSAIYTTFFSIFNTSWTEQVVLHYKDAGGKKYVSNMFEQMVTFFGCVAIGIIACMPFVFNILVDSKFQFAYGLVPFYMIAVFFNAVIGMISAIYLIENETKNVAISTAAAAVINIVVNIILIKRIGEYAAPVSSICGYAVISFWRLIDVNRRHCKITMRAWNILFLIIMGTVTTVVYYTNNYFVQFIMLFAVTIGSILVNRELLDFFLTPIIRKVKGK